MDSAWKDGKVHLVRNGNGRIGRCIGIGMGLGLNVMMHSVYDRAEPHAALGRVWDKCGYDCMNYERTESLGYTSGPRLR